MENSHELFQIMTQRFGLLNKNCCSLGENDISPAQSHILYEIDRQHKPSMQQVAEILGTDITTFSRQIQTLIKMNLVEKKTDPIDRRVYTLSLSVKGTLVSETIAIQMNEYLTEVFSYLSEFEKKTILLSVKLFNDAMFKSSRCCSQ